MSKPTIRDAVIDFIAEEDGPTAVEYAVMLSLLLLVCMGAIGALAQSTQENFNNSAEAIAGAFN